MEFSFLQITHLEQPSFTKHMDLSDILHFHLFLVVH